MARKTEITAESVAAAAAVLMERGENVTNKSILSEIGSGSMSTVVPLLAQWRAEQAESADLAEIEVPDDIAIAAEKLTAGLWRSAIREATAGHEGIRRDLLEARAETDAVRAEMIDLLAAVEAERDAHAARAEELTAQLAASVERGTASEARAVAAEREAAALTERAAAADRRADRADADREASEARAEKAEARAERAEDRADAAQRQITELTPKAKA